MNNADTDTNTGYNPMRWDCETQGCFNKKCRPKIEEFADALPGKISFTDVDGIVEVNGHFLLLEWKKSSGFVPTGQRIMYERLTRDSRFTVLVLAGNADTMFITAAMTFKDGACSDWHPATFDDIHRQIQKWGSRVRSLEKRG